ncbi:Acg family FMN-binding oxidoreductase [Thiocapsa bogorovii]|uniref:Acg family FMN-binding oxidoreductase n=1 Tax=Thiocapsa bogorovii TaxID=521689 RepID=UPI001E3D1F77|nr:Tat pathway signal protein [Thiocapsa bogorovii]UHD15857.1 Tat pathway signal protein [Thiocapsa bogorovii]
MTDSPDARQLELVSHAILAPSSHNTQCWLFRLGPNRIEILPDRRRRCPVVDPDDHHLFVSLGCAAENLLQAAPASGLRGEARFRADAGGSLAVALDAGPVERSALFEAIATRQSTRCNYDGRALSSAELRALEAAGSGTGVRVVLLTDRAPMERVLELVVEGNRVQLNDPAFVRELKDWVRFNPRQAKETGDGLFAACAGKPSLPPWLGRALFERLVSAKSENAKAVRQVRSSAGLAVFVSEVDEPAHWIEAGRAFERFALQATVLGVRTAHLNQPLEVTELRSELLAAIGLGPGRPDLLVRFGRGPLMPRSFRRPANHVVVKT